MAKARAYSVVDVILGEAGGKSKADRYQDMLNIASAIANRAAATGETPENIVSVRSQFNAYDKALPAGANAFRSLAEKAWNEIQTKGPVHSGTYFATSVAVDSLPRGLSRISDGVKGGHVIFADPKNRPIITASGVRPVDPLALVAPAKEAAQAADPFSILSPDLARPTGMAGPDSQSAREIAPGLGLGNLAPQTYPDMAGKAFGPAGGVDFNLGPKRPEMPNQGIVDIVRSAVDSVYGPDYKVEVYSGKGTGTGSNRHPTGNAVDVRIYTPEGRMLDAKTDKEGMLAVAQAAQAKGALGTGLGTDYMGGVGMHIDAVKPGRGQDHEWGNIANANKGLLTQAREKGQMPLPMRMAPPPSKPQADPFAALSPDLARLGSTRIAESAAYFPEEQSRPPPEMGAMRPPAPLAAPSEGRFARDFAPAGPMGIAPTPGLMGFGSSEPPVEMAPAGVRDGGPFSNIPMVPPNFQPQPEMAAMRPGIPQGSLPPNPMDAIRVAAPERSIPDIARVMAGGPISPGQYIGDADVERMKASRPTDGVPYSGPGSYITPEAIEQSRRANTPPSFFEGGMHRAGLMGMPAGPDPRTPMMAGGQMRAPDLKSAPFNQVAPKSVTTSRELRAALPMVPGFSMPARGLGQYATAAASIPERTGTTRGATRREPVRLVNPISVGQPGGKSGPGQTYGGTGLAAMMGVRSGMSPVGTVARSASNPDVMNVSLPHGNVAHINQAKGYISTWSPADDDERGTVYGKTLAIDPTGTKSSYVSAAKAQELASKGWTTYGPNTAPGPGKGFAKSTGPAAGTARSGGLMGFLSSLSNQSRGPAAQAGVGRGGLLGMMGLPGPLGLAAGMFGPGAGMGGLGLGGGMSGGGGFGGYGNPGFGGANQNDNYSGL